MEEYTKHMPTITPSGFGSIKISETVLRRIIATPGLHWTSDKFVGRDIIHQFDLAIVKETPLQAETCILVIFKLYLNVQTRTTFEVQVCSKNRIIRFKLSSGISLKFHIFKAFCLLELLICKLNT